VWQSAGDRHEGHLLLFFKRKSRSKKGRKKDQMPERQHATWGELLQEAVEKPGRMLEAYNKSLLTVALHV